MTIDKAIEILRKDIINPGSVTFEDIQEAEKLGIEALGVVLKAREGKYASFKLPLPGETFDDGK